MPSSLRSRDFKVTRPVVGTMRFASVPSHRGETAARRDDMEAIGKWWMGDGGAWKRVGTVGVVEVAG